MDNKVVSIVDFSEILIDRDEFKEALVSSLKNAVEKIYLQVMTFEGDKVGNEIFDILIEKAKKGVEVSVLIDSYINLYINDTFIFFPFTNFKNFLRARREHKFTFKKIKELEAAGGRVKLIHPLDHWGAKLFFRNHKKLITIDGKESYITGFGLSEHNFNWHDFAFKINNKEITESLEKEFLNDLSGHCLAESLETKIGAEQVSLLRQDKENNINEIDECLIRLISEAKESIFIESPYLSIKKIFNAIKNASIRGVKIKIILPGKNNLLFYKWLSSYYKNIFERKNIELYWYIKFNGMTHLKCSVVDRKFSIFGSSNFSELNSLSKELSLFVDSPNVAELLVKKIFEPDIANSRKESFENNFEIKKIWSNLLWGAFSSFFFVLKFLLVVKSRRDKSLLHLR